MVRGVQRRIRGTVAVISADNLGSLALGGFKESCSAVKMCRYCMTTKEESQMQVREKYEYISTYIFILYLVSRKEVSTSE